MRLNRRMNLGFLALMITIPWCVLGNPQKPENIVLAVSEHVDWYPYSYMENGKLVGTDIDLLRQVAHRINVNIDMLFDVPQRRLTSQNKHLGFNTVIGATFTQERSQSYWFSLPYRKEIISVFYTNSNFDNFKSLRSLLAASETSTVATNMSAYYGQEFDAVKQDYRHRFAHIETAERRVLMLAKNAIDVIVDDQLNIQSIIKERDIRGVKKANFIVIQQDVCFMFTKSDFDNSFVSRFNDALNLQLKSKTY